VERYEFDVAHTSIGFHGAAHGGDERARATSTDFSGQILLDPSDVTRSSVRVTIEAASIDTNNERRDDHLRSADFFEVERFPQLTFVSRRIERTADGLVLVGDLTIRDVTREVRIPFELSGPIEVGNGQRVGCGGHAADQSLRLRPAVEPHHGGGAGGERRGAHRAERRGAYAAAER
jgi:polyisoprenoid-binding protein YceI